MFHIIPIFSIQQETWSDSSAHKFPTPQLQGSSPCQLLLYLRMKKLQVPYSSTVERLTVLSWAQVTLPQFYSNGTPLKLWNWRSIPPYRPELEKESAEFCRIHWSQLQCFAGYNVKNNTCTCLLFTIWVHFFIFFMKNILKFFFKLFKQSVLL